jgi:hypothetical protein
MATRMQQRRGTAAQWTAANPTLAAGEIGFETDTNKFKMGNGSSAWTSLQYFVDASIVFDSSEVQQLIDWSVGNVVAGAPDALNTLNELANAINNDANYAYTVANTLSSVSNSLNAAQSNIIGLQNSVSGLDNVTASLSNSIELVANNLAAHDSDQTNVHGIANTLALVLTSDVRLSDERTPLSSSVTAAKIASDAIETAKIANAAVTASKLATDSVETAKIKDLAVTNAKLEGSIAQSKITDLVSNLSAKLESSTAATTYAPIASPTFTGTVSGVTKSHVGLGNVDNTTDANKPVSTATQTALDLKANLAGPTFTGTTTANTLIVDGNLTVNGNTFAASATTITIEDNLVQLAHENAANAVDLGLVVAYNDGTAKHSGIVRDVSDDKWKLFKGVTSEPTTTVNFGQGSLDTLAVAGIEATTATIGDVSNTELQYLNGVTSAVQTQIDTKAPIASPTFTGLVTVAANGIAYTDGTQTKEGVPSRTPIISKTASYTLTATSERDSLIEVDSTSATTITIPLNSAVAYPVGTTLDILQTNTGQVTIAGDSGVTVNATPGLKLRTRWSSCTLFKRATDSWVVYGDLMA